MINYLPFLSVVSHNNDGIIDFEAVYANGDKQIIYMLPDNL